MWCIEGVIRVDDILLALPGRESEATSCLRLREVAEALTRNHTLALTTAVSGFLISFVTLSPLR